MQAKPDRPEPARRNQAIIFTIAEAVISAAWAAAMIYFVYTSARPVF